MTDRYLHHWIMHKTFSACSPYSCLEDMPQCMIVINLVNQAFLTAAHPIIAKDMLKRFQFLPAFFFFFCKNENRSSTLRWDKLCLLARLMSEMVPILPTIQT